jgi:hypothetical protein
MATEVSKAQVDRLGKRLRKGNIIEADYLHRIIKRVEELKGKNDDISDRV